MSDSKKNQFVKISLTLMLISTLFACGGSSSNRSVELSGTTSISSPSNDFALYSSEGESDGLEKIQLTPEQQANFLSSFQAFEQKAQTVENVNGFIIKYKSSSSSENSDLTSPNGLDLSPTSESSSKFSLTQSQDFNAVSPANLVGRMGMVTAPYGVSLRFKTVNFTGATVVDASQQLTLKKAQAIASEMQKADPSIEYVEPNITMTSTALPSSAETAALWGMKTASSYGINAEQAWGVTDGTGTVVAVVDTGYRPHVDLAGRWVMNGNSIAGYDFIGNVSVANDGNGRDSDATDPGDACNGYGSSWHGTHVAGTVAAASNGFGVAGVAYGAKILPVRVLGKCGGTLDDVAAGVVWAAGGSVSGVPNNPNPAKVINLSLGGSSSTCGPTMKSAIDTARSLGAVVVVAAGNSGVDAQFSTPANCSAAVTVAATDSNGLLAYFSNYGSLVDVAAPGVNIQSTINSGATVPVSDNVYANYSGTSMATPHVAGTLALMFSKDPTLTPSAAESKLVLNTRAFSPYFNTSRKAGSGIADAYKVILSLTNTTPNPNPVEEPTPPPPTEPKKGKVKPRDFNGDSISDAIWQDTRTGWIRFSLLSATTLTSRDLSSYQSKTYSVQTTGDFNGDGKKDLVIRNLSNGQAIISLMNGALIESKASINTVSLNYTAVASGDFDQDGKEDILWRNATGWMFISYMDGVKEVKRSGTLKISSSLKLQGVADFNQDSIDDLLFRAPDGTIVVLQMSSTGGYWIPVATASSNLQIIGVGDYDGDTYSDLLFRNSRNGLLTFFGNPLSQSYQILLSSNSVSSVQSILPAGDHDGDGKTDILLRHVSKGDITRVNLNISGGNFTLQQSSRLGSVPITLLAR